MSLEHEIPPIEMCSYRLASCFQNAVPFQGYYLQLSFELKYFICLKIADKLKLQQQLS
jgi:hypothetical protein